MSYDIELKDPVSKETIEFDVPHQIRGGTYAVGGTTEAWLNVTYNYANWYYKDGVFPKTSDGESLGIRTIYGMSGADSIPVLQNAIDVLNRLDEDLSVAEIREYISKGVTGYWVPTKANAIKPLYQLLAFAKLRPDGVWRGD